MRVAYAELHGRLSPLAAEDAAEPHAPADARVTRSNLVRGEAPGVSRDGLAVNFVGRGAEHYQIGGRYYRLGENQLMISPKRLPCEVTIRRSEELAGTLGLCLFLASAEDDLEHLVQTPIVLPADCALGRQLQESLGRLSLAPGRQDEATRLALRARALLTRTILDLDQQVSNMPGARRSTQFESVRRMNLARSYLHQVVDRSVSLEELAREAAVSPYHLLRSFRRCFGETPAAYHRRLRLELVRQCVEREGLSYAFVSDRFGFAGGSSFNHAYKRTHGVSPVRQIG